MANLPDLIKFCEAVLLQCQCVCMNAQNTHLCVYLQQHKYPCGKRFVESWGCVRDLFRYYAVIKIAIEVIG